MVPADPRKPKRAVDRRVEKTDSALRQALFGLMVEKGYEETTVADIAQRANVGRSTFYAHYADKEALLRESLRGLREYLLGAAADPAREQGHPALAFSLPMLEHIQEVKELFRALAGKQTGAPVQKELHLMLTDLVRGRLEEPNARLPGSPELVAEFIVGAFLSVCFWWMSEGSKISPQQVDAAFRALLTSGLPPASGTST